MGDTAPPSPELTNSRAACNRGRQGPRRPARHSGSAITREPAHADRAARRPPITVPVPPRGCPVLRYQQYSKRAHCSKVRRRPRTTTTNRSLRAHIRRLQTSTVAPQATQRLLDHRAGTLRRFATVSSTSPASTCPVLPGPGDRSPALPCITAITAPPPSRYSGRIAEVQ